MQHKLNLPSLRLVITGLAKGLCCVTIVIVLTQPQKLVGLGLTQPQKLVHKVKIARAFINFTLALSQVIVGFQHPYHA